MNYKEILKQINQDMVNVALANKRVEVKRREILDEDGIYLRSEYYDSDAEDFKHEAQELRRQTREELKDLEREL